MSAETVWLRSQTYGVRLSAQTEENEERRLSIVFYPQAPFVDVEQLRRYKSRKGKPRWRVKRIAFTKDEFVQLTAALMAIGFLDER